MAAGGPPGRPKGVVGTAGSIAAMTTVQLAEWEWPEALRFLMCTPLSHAGAAFFLPLLMAGGSMVVLPKFDPAEVLAAIEEHRISATMLVPSMLYAPLDHPDAETRDLSILETVYYGAAATIRCGSVRRYAVGAGVRAVLRPVRVPDGRPSRCSSPTRFC